MMWNKHKKTNKSLLNVPYPKAPFLIIFFIYIHSYSDLIQSGLMALNSIYVVDSQIFLTQPVFTQ